MSTLKEQEEVPDWSGGRAGDSWHWGHEFEPHTEDGNYFKKLIII